MWGWGFNYHGQIGDGTHGANANKPIPVLVNSDDDWVLVSSGFYHTAALKSDGSLWTWGNNTYGQLGDGTDGISTSKYVPTRIGRDNDWVSVSVGVNHTVGLKSDGSLWAWGLNYHGQLGIGTNGTAANPNIADRKTPTRVGRDNDWVHISVGTNSSAALKSNGTLWTWGKNEHGELGIGTGGFGTDENVPTQVGKDQKDNWVSVSLKGLHAVALKSDGTLWTWGWNGYGQLGNGHHATFPNLNTYDVYLPIRIGKDNDWVSASASFFNTVALKSDGSLWTWGNNTYGQLGIDTNGVGTTNGTGTDRDIPTRVGRDNDWISVDAGDSYTGALKSNGDLYLWGFNSHGNLGYMTSGTVDTPIRATSSNRDWLQVATGGDHTVALRSDGTLWSWGLSVYGQLGDGTYSTDVYNFTALLHKSIPVQVGTDNDWVSVAASDYYTLALKSDGTMWEWGDNTLGSFGHPDITGGPYTNKPKQIGRDHDWVNISAGAWHSLALKSDGTLWAWGENGAGCFGNGQAGGNPGADEVEPVQCSGKENSDWVSISASARFSVGLKSDGSLWSWGDNERGQLGLGYQGGTHLIPFQIIIGKDYDWTTISTGGDHTLALKSNGTLWSWGHNSNGQLGIGGTPGTYSYKLSPEYVISKDAWINIMGGGAHSAGLNASGELWNWGSNYTGQLGNTLNYNDVPVPTIITKEVIALSKGLNSTQSGIIRKNRANICMTGSNIYGQLGDGTTTNTNSFSCSNSICRAHTILDVASAPASQIQPLAGFDNPTNFQKDCQLIATVMPSGVEPVMGDFTAQVFIENPPAVPPVPTYNGREYVARHYDLQPDPNVNSLDNTAEVTLYFTQQEFDDYNNANAGASGDLPSTPTNGTTEVRVSLYRGIPTGSGCLPSDYDPNAWAGASPAQELLTPLSVEWDYNHSYWKVRLSVTGFGGFFLHGDNGNVLRPVSGSTTSNAATLSNLDKSVSLKNAVVWNSNVDKAGLLEAENVVRIYPSPVNDYIIVQSSTGAAVSGVLTDMQGKVLMQVDANSGDRINVSALASGLYMLRLADGNTFKVVIRH